VEGVEVEVGHVNMVEDLFWVGELHIVIRVLYEFREPYGVRKEPVDKGKVIKERVPVCKGGEVEPDPVTAHPPECLERRREHDQVSDAAASQEHEVLSRREGMRGAFERFRKSRDLLHLEPCDGYVRRMFFADGPGQTVVHHKDLVHIHSGVCYRGELVALPLVMEDTVPPGNQEYHPFIRIPHPFDEALRPACRIEHLEVEAVGLDSPERFKEISFEYVDPGRFRHSLGEIRQRIRIGRVYD